MEGLILGIDLCDDYCKVSGIRPNAPDPEDICFAEADGRTMIQTALGKKKEINEWMIGREAYEAALTGEGMIVDKLLSRLEAREVIRSYGKEYTAQELMTAFLGQVLDCAFRELGCRQVQQLVISVRQVTLELIDSLTACIDALGLKRENFHLVNHTEAYLYYVLAQKKELWANETILFEWSGTELHFYDMTVTRGIRPHVVRVTHQLLKEDFSSENLNDERYQKVADSQLAAYAQKLMERKIVSFVLLTGKGLEDCLHWKTRAFLEQLCQRRKVWSEASLFARGALIIGVDDTRETTAYPYTIICEGRIQASVTLDGISRGVPQKVFLARQGSCWYNTRNTVDLILDSREPVVLREELADGKLTRKFTILLDNFPKRPPKTTRAQVILNFVSEHEAVVRIVDKGFGDMFPATGAVKKTSIML